MLVEADQAAIFASVSARLFGTRSTTLARYIPRAQIGHGAHGVVWRAEDPLLRRSVAVKLVRTVPYETRGLLTREQRLLREARALAQLAHPNIVGVYDVGRWERGADSGLFVVMELLEGGDLQTWLQTNPAWQKKVGAFIAAGRGLQAAHAVGVLHRDFKASNVLLGSGGEIKVCDFGLARVTFSPSSSSGDQPSAALTATGCAPGTPAYMPPEQFAGWVTEASDQYAFCAALFEAITGSLPFAGETAADLLLGKRRDELRLEPWPRQVPQRVLDDLRRGMASDPAKRWPSLDVLLHRLSAMLQHRRRWFPVLGMGAAVVATSALASPRGEACVSAMAPINAVWAEPRRTELLADLRALDAHRGARISQSVDNVVTGYVTAFEAAWVRDCQARRDNPAVAARLECLGDRAAELDALLDQLRQVETLDPVVEAVEALSSISSCEDAVQRVDPRADKDRARMRHALAKARAMGHIGRLDAALNEVDAALQLETPASDPLLVLELAAERLDWLHRMGRVREVEQEAQRLYMHATALRVERVAVESALMMALLEGTDLRRPEAARHWLRAAEVIYERAGRPLELAAQVLATEASVLSSAMEHDASIRAYQQAVAACARTMCKPEAKFALLFNLGLSLQRTGRFAEAAETLTAAYELSQKHYGDHSARTAEALAQLGAAVGRQGDPDTAAEHLRAAIVIAEESYGPHALKTIRMKGMLGQTLGRAGDFEGALPLFQEVAEHFDTSIPSQAVDAARVYTNIGNLHRRGGRLEEAARALERALELFPADHPEVRTPLTILGDIRVEQERFTEAVPLLEASLAVAQRVGDDAVSGEARLLLARALVGTGRNINRAIELATRAEQDFAAVGDEALLHKAREWLALHSRRSSKRRG